MKLFTCQTIEPMNFNKRGHHILESIRCNGETMVNVCYPLRFDKKLGKLVPSPTVFWLVSKSMKKSISHLEERGLIPEFERIIKNNFELLESIKSQHERYRDMRWNMLTIEHQEYVKTNGWTEEFQTGIGGIRNWDAVKCLHLHYAHYCHSRDNAIGQMVSDHLIKMELTP
jgi:hypothetical protein